jgi:hypothetical protein
VTLFIILIGTNVKAGVFFGGGGRPSIVLRMLALGLKTVFHFNFFFLFAVLKLHNLDLHAVNRSRESTRTTNRMAVILINVQGEFNAGLDDTIFRMSLVASGHNADM